jgi:hypothetical protein
MKQLFMRRKTELQQRQKGSALLTVIIMLPFLILIIALYMDLSVASFNQSRGDQSRTHAQFATDAGTDYAVQKINADPDWTGTIEEAPVDGEVELHNDGKIKTTFEISVVDVDADTKTITSVGKTYSPVTATTAKSDVTIKTDLRKVTSGNYSIVTGVGGLYMSNSSKILGGSILINGEVSLSNTAQIGLSTNPVTMDVAHQICPNPANATYPRVCNSGEFGEPIEISNSAHIYGTVRANNQVSTAGITDPGITATSGVVPQALPVHDRDAQKAAITSTINATTANCSSGTHTWAANLKITGNVVISGSCQVTVSGDVWITGTFEVRNSAQVIVADSMGATRPNIMIDGSAAQFKNTAQLKSNASGTGFQIVTYRSSPSCSPDCSDVTGVELYNSRNLTTISLANSSSAPNTVFYAKWSRVTVANTGQIGALIGQTVELSNSGTITFGTSVGTGTSFWVIDNYRRTFN